MLKFDLEYKIDSLSEKDSMFECISIIDSVLGKNYVDAKKLVSMVKDDNFICLKATTLNDKIVGVAIACIMSVDEAIEYLKIEKYEIPDDVRFCDNISIIKIVAIDDNFQKIGIGTNFIRELEKIFWDMNLRVIFIPAWRHDNIENIGELLVKNGYKSLCIIERYYEKDSLKGGFSCPVCGDNGCHCDVNIFFKVV